MSILIERVTVASPDLAEFLLAHHADFFGPARALYARAGFEECEPFGRYAADPHSTFMTVAPAPASDGASRAR